MERARVRPVPIALKVNAKIVAATTGEDGLARWGHSMMQDSGSSSGGWILDAADDLGVPGANGGVSGEDSTGIALRQGGLRPLLTFPGGTIPAPTTATVVTVTPSTTDGGLEFGLRTAGATSSAGTASPAGTVVAGDTVALKVSADGLALTAFVNGVSVNAVTLSGTGDNVARTGTLGGLRIGTGTTARSDDFRVYDK